MDRITLAPDPKAVGLHQPGSHLSVRLSLAAAASREDKRRQEDTHEANVAKDHGLTVNRFHWVDQLKLGSCRIGTTADWQQTWLIGVVCLLLGLGE